MSDVATIDVLDGIPLDSARLLRNKHDRPELQMLVGDSLIVHEADTAEPGQVVVAEVDGLATVRRHEEGGAWRVMGLVVGVVRRLGDVG